MISPTTRAAAESRPSRRSRPGAGVAAADTAGGYAAAVPRGKTGSGARASEGAAQVSHRLEVQALLARRRRGLAPPAGGPRQPRDRMVQHLPVIRGAERIRRPRIPRL